jgi:hypothetical protein
MHTYLEANQIIFCWITGTMIRIIFWYITKNLCNHIIQNLFTVSWKYLTRYVNKILLIHFLIK